MILHVGAEQRADPLQLRTVSGVIGLAVRHEAVQYNPTREVSRILGSRRKVPWALTRDERDRWLAALDADPQAVRKDLPDLTRWMLATGVRSGEAGPVVVIVGGAG